MSLSMSLATHHSACLSVCRVFYVCLSMSRLLCVCLSVYVFVCVSVCVCSYTSFSLSVCLSVCLYVCLSVCLSICLSVCVSVCVCVSSYTLVFLHYAFSLASLLLFRPLISAKLTQDGGTKSIYAALYFLPILVCVNAVFAGFICTYFLYCICN